MRRLFTTQEAKVVTEERKGRIWESHHGAQAGRPKKKVRPFTAESEEGATASRLLPQPLLSIDIVQGRHHLLSDFPQDNCQVHERPHIAKCRSNVKMNRIDIRPEMGISSPPSCSDNT
jgi:hypothetical protein